MKILVTGASGFVGGHLCRKLIKHKHTIFPLVRNQNKWDALSITTKNLINGDLSASKSNSWIQALPEDLDCVIHTAGIVHTIDDTTFYTINENATKQLIEDLAKRYKDRPLTFILISSLAAAGPSADNSAVDEEDLPAPISHYGKSKLGGEIALQNFAPATWKRIVIRPPIVIGPNDPAFIDVFKMVKSGFVFLAGRGARFKRYSFVSVFDLVEVITSTLSVETTPGVIDKFYAANPEGVTYQQMIDAIQKCMNITNLRYITVPNAILKLTAHIITTFKIQSRLTPDKYLEITAQNWCCKSKKSMEKLNVQYHDMLTDIINKTYTEDYRSKL